MAYSKSLAARVHQALGQRRAIVEKKMFGGVGFLLHGNMLVGVWQNALIVRLGPDEGAKALTESNVVPFDITGKPMKGWVVVEPDGLESDRQLARWVERAEAFVATLPPRAAKP
jgi:TfoX/Sxy family transcriptional regulator of competence genes